ncbi:MAG: response regulator [Gammaproteobacteria bacterium]
MPGHILIVDDDRELSGMLGEYLAREGFGVASAPDAEAAANALAAREPDLVILDVMLPGRSGLDLLRELRAARPRLPVLMLTARGDPVDRIIGLELGADDYLPKPFDPRELAARARAILRRAPAHATATGGAGDPTAAPADDAPLRCGPLQLDLRRRRAALGEATLELTGAEWRVLVCLVQAGDGPVERGALTQQALGRRLALYDRAIDTHVSNLRRKLTAAGGGVQIRAVRGAGYELIEDDPA